MEKQDLIDLAFDALKNSYAPYSNFHVGAALLCKDGTIFKGVNIENASFGATNCAERSALFAAVSNGYKKGDFEAIAIVSDGERIAAPCGICRQVFAEWFEKDTPFYLANFKEQITKTIVELLPMMFEDGDVLR